MFQWKKNNIFLRFCLCIFESDTVKSDCPVQIIRKMMKYLKIYLTSFTVFLEILKKSTEKKSSENDQSTGHFQSFFIYLFFFVPQTLVWKKNPVNQLVKKIGLSAATTCRIKGSTKTSTLAEYGTKNITVQDQCSNYNFNSMIKADNHVTIQQQQKLSLVLQLHVG